MLKRQARVPIIDQTGPMSRAELQQPLAAPASTGASR